MLLNSPHLALELFTVHSYVSTPHLIGTLIALCAPVFSPHLLDQREGLWQGKSKAVLSGWGLCHFPGCTCSECLEKCPSKSWQIKRCRQMQRWSSVRRCVTWSKSCEMCKDGKESKFLIQHSWSLWCLCRGVLPCSHPKAAEIFIVPPMSLSLKCHSQELDMPFLLLSR